MATSQDLVLLRQALIRELETINHYQELHDRASDPTVRELLSHLMDEEKEHVAELTTMLRARDPVQERFFRQDHGAEFARGAPEAHVTTSWTGRLTVGSLFGTPSSAVDSLRIKS